MIILQHVKTLQQKVREHGNYRAISKNSGVGYHWLCKFAAGSIANPGVENISRLEVFFEDGNNKVA